MINSLKTYETLKAGELSDTQAHAITEAIGSGLDDNNTRQAEILAAKDEVGRMESQAIQMEATLKQEMTRMESALHLDMARLDTNMARLETRFADTKSEMLRWMFVFWVGQVAATVAMVKLIK